MRLSCLRDDILNVCRSGPLTAKQIAKRLGTRNNSHLRVMLSRLRKSGELTWSAEGYRTAAHPRPMPATAAATFETATRTDEATKTDALTATLAVVNRLLLQQAELIQLLADRREPAPRLLRIADITEP